MRIEAPVITHTPPSEEVIRPPAPFVILPGSGNPNLTVNLYRYLSAYYYFPSPPQFDIHARFADGAVKSNINLDRLSQLQGKEAIIMQSFGDKEDPESHMREVFNMADTARRNGARAVHVIAPYLANDRQDKAFRKGEAPSGVHTVRLLMEIVDRITTVDMHNPAITEEYAGRWINLHASQALFDNQTALQEFEHFLLMKWGLEASQIVAVSPDLGGMERAQYFGERASCRVVDLSKTRDRETGASQAVSLNGDVRDEVGIIIDDKWDSGGTLIKAAEMAKNEGGARAMMALIGQAILSGNALDRLYSAMDGDNPLLKRLYFTNARSLPPTFNFGIFRERVVQLDLAPILAQHIIDTANS